MIALLLLISCVTGAETPENQTTTIIEEPQVETDPAEVAKEIEQAADPGVEHELEILRETVKELHGEEAVEAILAERRAALERAAVELAAQRVESVEKEAEAVEKAVQMAQAEPPVIQPDTANGNTKKE